MMFALVSPSETVPGGWRIAQVEAEPFEVAPPLVWHKVPDNATAHGWFWTGTTAVPKPVKATIIPPVKTNAPPAEVG